MSFHICALLLSHLYLLTNLSVIVIWGFIISSIQCYRLKNGHPTSPAHRPVHLCPKAWHSLTIPTLSRALRDGCGGINNFLMFHWGQGKRKFQLPSSLSVLQAGEQFSRLSISKTEPLSDHCVRKVLEHWPT